MEDSLTYKSVDLASATVELETAQREIQRLSQADEDFSQEEPVELCHSSYDTTKQRELVALQRDNISLRGCIAKLRDEANLDSIRN